MDDAGRTLTTPVTAKRFPLAHTSAGCARAEVSPRQVCKETKD